MAGKTILDIIFAREVKREGDTYLPVLKKALEVVDEISNAGSFLGKLFTKNRTPFHHADTRLAVDSLPIRT